MKNQDKIILDLCGGTGSWSAPYKDAGYDVRNITLPEWNVIDTAFYKSDYIIFCSDCLRRNKLEILTDKIYGILAAPPCDQFSFAKTTGKPRNLKEGMEIVRACLNIIWGCQYKLEKPFSKKTTLKFWALENPKGMLKHFLGKPIFEFNPNDFGDPYQKPTYLWGNFNSPKKNPIPPLFIYGKQGKREWDVHAKTGGKSVKTKELRSITPPRFAKAFYEANK